MAGNSFLDKPDVHQEGFTGSFKTWLFKLWSSVQNLSGASGNTTISGNVTVTGVVTDAQTYTRNLGIYHGLLGE